MSAAALTSLPGLATAAERSRLAVQRGRADASCALEEGLRSAERTVQTLFEVEKLELLPAGIRDRARRLAVQMSAEVNSISALAQRLEKGR